MKYFNPKLQLKDTESALKTNLKKVLSELSGSKLMTTLVSVTIKTEIEDKTKYDSFYSYAEAAKLSMKVILMMYLNQSALELYKTYQNP